MFGPWLALLLALQGQGASELRAAAAVTPRPQVCAPARGVWERARAHGRLRDCATLAKALAALDRDPAAALRGATSLAKSELKVPAAVIGGRARLALGDAAGAWADFRAAQASSSSALADPLARHDAGN